MHGGENAQESALFFNINHSFARRRLWKFRRQEILVGLIELAFVGAACWFLFR